MKSNSNGSDCGQALRELARQQIVPLLGAIIIALAYAGAPALAQQDNCYPGLDCPEDIHRNAPPRAPSPTPEPQYQEPLYPTQPPRPYPARPNYLQPGYSAQAYCSITGAVGSSFDMPSPRIALRAAVYDCVARGGVPRCCVHGARLTE